MLTVEDLADEITLEIFSHIPCADLANVCLISRRVGAIGRFSLYREPVLINHRFTGYSIQLFLRTVIPNPTLAGYVRHLTLDCHDSPAPDGTHELSSVTTALFLATARDLGLPSDASRLLLLVHLLPNLKALTLHRDSRADLFDGFIANHVYPGQARTLPAGFQSLRYVHFEFAWGWPVEHTPKILMALLSLPSIRTINVQIKDSFDPTEFTGISSSVVDLTLRSGSMSHESLAHILQVPRALTRLSLEHCYLTNALLLTQASIPIQDNFHVPDFGRALRTVRTTLQHLRLSLCDYMNMGPEFTSDGEPNTLGSLHDWPVLKTVRCPLTALLGQGPEVATSRLVDVLPVGIVEFSIEGDRYWTGEQAADQVEAMLDQKDIVGLESLEVIVVGRRLSREVGRLAVACAAAGVVLRLNSTWC